MKIHLWIVFILAMGCGEAVKKQVPGNNPTNNSTNSATNNSTTSSCCDGLQCGESTTCAAVECGTCDETSFCSDLQQCEPLPADAPQIIALSSDTPIATPSTTLIITAVVSDPDGIDDLVGGELRAPNGESYGPFEASAAEGSYQLSLTWAQLNAVQAIVFDAPMTRELVAEFYDQAGNKTQRALTITIACQDTNDAACEPGVCADLDTDSDHCGACGNVIGEVATCVAGQPKCAQGDYCADSQTCSDFSDLVTCGTCTNNCVEKNEQLGFTDENDILLECTAEKNCEILRAPRVAGICNDICGAATCIKGGASFLAAALSGSCDTDFTKPEWIQQYGAFENMGCLCRF